MDPPTHARGFHFCGLLQGIKCSESSDVIVFWISGSFLSGPEKSQSLLATLDSCHCAQASLGDQHQLSREPRSRGSLILQLQQRMLASGALGSPSGSLQTCWLNSGDLSEVHVACVHCGLGHTRWALGVGCDRLFLPLSLLVLGSMEVMGGRGGTDASCCLKIAE